MCMWRIIIWLFLINFQASPSSVRLRQCISHFREPIGFQVSGEPPEESPEPYADKLRDLAGEGRNAGMLEGKVDMQGQN